MKVIRIFISHQMEDIRLAESLKERIDTHSYMEAVLVVKDSKPSELFERQVESGIKSSNYFVPILTCSSLKSIWVNQEIGYAKAKQLPIYALIENDILDNLKGFIHKHREHYIYSPKTFEAKSNELIEKVKENEGLGTPNYVKLELESEGNLAKSFTLDPEQELDENTLLHLRMELFNETQEIVFYIHFERALKDIKGKNIGFSNSDIVDNTAENVIGQEHVFQFDLPGKITYEKVVNVFNIIRQSGLEFDKFPNVASSIRIRNINGERGKMNKFYYAFSQKSD